MCLSKRTVTIDNWMTKFDILSLTHKAFANTHRPVRPTYPSV